MESITHATALTQARRYNDPSQDARIKVRDLRLAGWGIELGDTLIVQPLLYNEEPELVLCRKGATLYTMPGKAGLSDMVGKIIAYLRGGIVFHVKHQAIQ